MTRTQRSSRRAGYFCYATVLMLASSCGSEGDNNSGPVGNEAQDTVETGMPTVDDPAATETAVDITNAILAGVSSDCADYADTYVSTVTDVNRNMGFGGDLRVTITDDHCVFRSNAIPNHDFNDGDHSFVTATTTQSVTYQVPRTPVVAGAPTALSLRTDNAIFLNGVKLDLLAAGCFGVGDGRIGCFEMGAPFRYDPMAATANFGTDSHNAHTQPDGTYHYHGNPNAMFAKDGSASPVIGFAADGFPVYGTYIRDGDGVRKVTSSYAVRSGSRQAARGIDPGGPFDGTFVDDYEYIEGSGDLDACNGMTVEGAYGYYVTDAYPWVLGCLKGTPDPSFDK